MATVDLGSGSSTNYVIEYLNDAYIYDKQEDLINYGMGVQILGE